MAAVDEIAIKLGINTGDFKAALADANAKIKVFKKEGESKPNEGLLGTLTKQTQSLNQMKTLLTSSAMAAAVRGFFNLAINAAQKSTDATDENARAVRDFAKGLDDVKGVAGTVAVATIGFFNRIGESIGTAINLQKGFILGGREGLKEAARIQNIVEETGRAAEQVERNLAEARRKHGAEFISLHKERDALLKKIQDRQLQGLALAETEANLTAKLTALLEKQAKFQGDAIGRERLVVEVLRARNSLEEVHFAVRKANAAEEKKQFEEYAKAATERRKELSLSAEEEIELFTLRQRSAEAAAEQGRIDLNIITLQNKQIAAQLDVAKLRAKITESLTPAEKEFLEQLIAQTEEIQKQIAQKQKLLAASNNRNPVEEKLLEQLQAQALALTEQIIGLNERASVTNTFTAAEAEFLAQLEKQKRAIFEQIILLEERAEIPNTLTKEEEELLGPLNEQLKVYSLLILAIKERAGSGQAQTAEEIEYLDALKASAVKLSDQIELMRERNGASDGLNASETDVLNKFEGQAVALGEAITALRERQNSSTGISEAEAELLIAYEKETTALEAQITAMTQRQTATGNLAAVEADVLDQWRAQQEALLDQIEAMRTRRDSTVEQRKADEQRLSVLLDGLAATKAQIDAIEKGGEVTLRSLDATKQMAAADKERLALLELGKVRQKEIVELKRLDAQIQAEGVNAALAKERDLHAANLREIEKQIAYRQKISIGVKEDIELYRLRNKEAGTLTTHDVERLQLLTRQQDELRKQREQKERIIEIERLHGLLLEGRITGQQRRELESLIKQSDEYKTHLRLKLEMVNAVEKHHLPAERDVTEEYETQQRTLGSVITEEERAALEATGVRLPAEARVTAELQAQLNIVKEIAEREAKILALRTSSVTNTGDVTSLSAVQLQALILNLQRDITSLKASQFGTNRPSAEQTILDAALNNALTELNLRREFERLQKNLGDQFVERTFSPNEYQRLSQLFNPDLQRQTANAITNLSNGFSRVFPEQFRDIRYPLPLS